MLLFEALFKFSLCWEATVSPIAEGAVRPGQPPTVSFYHHLSKQTSLLSAAAAAPDPAPGLSAVGPLLEPRCSPAP